MSHREGIQKTKEPIDLVLESGDLRTENISAEENRERGEDSLKWVFDRQTDQKQAMHRWNIGWVAFLWGSAGSGPGFEDGDGISRIIAMQDARRKDDSTLAPGRRVVESAPEIIAKGRVTRKYGSPGDTKIDITYNRNVVMLNWDKSRRTLYLRDIRVEAQGFVMESAGEDYFSRIIKEIREAQDFDGIKSAFRKAEGVLSKKTGKGFSGFCQ